MSMSVVLRAVSAEQARALSDGRIKANDLITPASASYTGEGDVTHIGCGCFLTLVVVATVLPPVWNLFGWRVALVTTACFEIWVIAYAWQIRSMSRRKVNLDQVDPLTIVQDSDELCLNYWHGLHFLLTGTAWEGEPPLNFLLHGGDVLPEDESDLSEYGPDRVIVPDDLSAIDAALAEVVVADAAEKLKSSPETIYPGRWDDPSSIDALAREMSDLKLFITSASKANQFVVLGIH